MKKFAPVSSTTTKNFKSITFTVQELFHEQATVLYFEMDSSSQDVIEVLSKTKFIVLDQ